MAARLKEKQKQQIIADYVETGNYSAVARKHGVSASSVKNFVLKNTDFVEMCERKKEENSADILAHMEKQTEQVCSIIDTYLEALADRGKIESATLSQLTTALGTLIDKFTMIKTIKKNGGDIEDLTPLAEMLKRE